MKTTVISVLGTQKDAHGGTGPSRWDTWRPTIDLVQLVHVVRTCRASESMADAARKLFAVSFKSKKSSNNTDRLSKYLAKFGLKFRTLLHQTSSPFT